MWFKERPHTHTDARIFSLPTNSNGFRLKPSSWQLISAFLSLHHIVDQSPVTERPAQNSMIMSCQMPITNNSTPQQVVNETVTQSLPSSASSLLFHTTFEEFYLFFFFYLNVMSTTF